MFHSQVTKIKMMGLGAGDPPMQFMLPRPEKAPSGTFLMRLSWIRSSTKDDGRFLGISVNKLREKYIFCKCRSGVKVFG